MVGGDSAGGSAELARLIDRCGEEVTADLQQYYGLDVADVLRANARLSPRRTLVLLRQLPPESATFAALRGGSEFRGWGPDRYLMAQLVDSVRENTFAFISANSKRKPQAPEPVERPERYAERTRGKNSFRALATAFLGARRAKKGT